MNKICFICPSLHQGGLENAVTVIANEIAQRGYEVSIVCIYNNSIFYKLHKTVKIVLPSYKRGGHSTLSYYWRSILYIRKQVKYLKPDVIISYGDYINPLTILATRGLKIPLYISDRSSPSKSFPFIVKKMRKYSYPLANGIIAQTERAKEQKKEMLGRHYTNIKVIPNPIRPIIEYTKIKQENVILGVGRHYKVKGLDRLIKAYSKLSASGWKLVIAGNFGPHTPELKQLVKQHNLEDKVEFLGPIKDIDKLYCRAKIFVLSSRSEGFPNALIEAMASGLACISYDIVAGPSEVIRNNKNGLLLEEQNTESLTCAIEKLISNDELRKSLGKEAEKLRKDLSVESIATTFLNFVKPKKI